jgi:putative endonuclease
VRVSARVTPPRDCVATLLLKGRLEDDAPLPGAACPLRLAPSASGATMTGEIDAKKRASHRFGLQAETLAALYLQMKFYRILARRYRVQGGEVDIIERRGDVIAFVEVKARGDMDAALTAITPQKKRRFSKADAHWLTRNPWAATQTLRTDAIFIARRQWPHHIESVMEMRF